jgi:hypothetical protein
MRAIEGTRRRARTSFYCIGLRVVPDVWRLGFRNLHKAVLLDLSEGEVFLIPLQAAGNS